jgi:hypothetical protein
MDIAREHARLGLATSQGKRKLGHNDEPGDTPKTVVTPAPGAPELDDTSFTAIARHLIEFANDADLPEPETPVPSITVPATTNRRARQPARTCIELKDVFDFTNPASGLDFYWKGGELNLEKQGESVEQDHVDELGLDIGQSQAMPLGSAASSSNISSSPFSV